MKHCKECNMPLKPGVLPVRSVTECFGAPVKEEIITKAHTVKCIKCGLDNHFEEESRTVFDNTAAGLIKNIFCKRKVGK